MNGPAIDLLRHGETDAQGFRGRSDDTLTETGWAQMRRGVEGAGPWASIVTSPLRRCADFARWFAADRGLPLRIEPRLIEYDFGAWEGRAPAEILRESPGAVERFWADPWQYPPPGGETMENFETRVQEAWGDLSIEPGPVLVVTHGGVIRLLLCQAQGLPRSQLLRLDVRHGALVRLPSF